MIMEHFPYEAPRPMQTELLETLEREWDNYDVFVVTAPTGCHAPGQGILMADGSVKLVENIEVGDELIGPDSTIRRVHTLYRGEDEMYRIVPRRGKSWICNGEHVLNVNQYHRTQSGNERISTTRNINITVNDFIGKSNNFRNTCTLWKPSEVTFIRPTEQLTISPYILGLWLGDGTSSGPHLTTMDDDIGIRWIEWGERLGCHPRVESMDNNRACTIHLRTDRGLPNPCLDELRKWNLIYNKHIPDAYLYADIPQVKELLAGLMDTDGYFDRRKHSAEITQKNKRLAEQILFLCRRLGYSASIHEKVVNDSPYWRVTFSGIDLECIPTMCSRKDRPLNAGARMTNCRFEVQPVGRGTYYGFGVDGDNLYLLDDFTVTHNSGKTAISKTIMDWTGSATYIAPTNQLITQFLQEFPDTPVLHSVEKYTCIDYPYQTCGATQRKEGGMCRGCDCAADLRQATWSRESGIYNYYTYLSRRSQLYRPSLIIDEAHNVIKLIQSLNSERIWQHQAKYPNSLITDRPSTISNWIEGLSPGRRRGKKISKLHRAVTSEAPEHIVERTLEMFNGKGTRRGRPEERDCIVMTPIDVRDANPVLWPRGSVDKIVLLSATISDVDIRDLGLDRRRVCYLDCKSPIPVDRRLTHLDYVTTVSHSTTESGTRKIVNYIESDILPQYEGAKGIIHSTYEQAKLISRYSTSGRFLFHDSTNKMQVYNRFRNSDPSEGRVLVACGMQEGVDLPEDAGRFQVIAKIPWQSLADGAIRHRSESDPLWYTWNTLRDVIQACGRICRTPRDWGDTIILDGSMDRLLRSSSEYGIIPEWFEESLVSEKGDVA